MKYCKFCNAELMEGSTVCPGCGKDNAKRVSAGKTVLAVMTVLAFAVLLTAVVLYSGKVSNGEVVPMNSEEAVAVETEPEETAAPTVPADGNPDDITCKGTYTDEDAAVIAARDVVVATAGDRQLTVGQLQAFYWMQVRNFLTQYGAYAAYFGLDVTQPLDTQMCPDVEPAMTWQQYFLESALSAWNSYSSMAAEADANGYTMPQEQQDSLTNAAADLEETAQMYGFESGLAMVQNSLGAAAELEDYVNFMTLYYKANGYYNFLAESVEYTDEQLEAFFAEHAEGYEASGITKDSISVDVRHILIYPEGADGGNLNTEEFSEEAWQASETAANALLEQWLAGDKTEESFAALANEHSEDPGSNTNGGLYEGVTQGEMVQAFNDWCFDPARQVGDTGVVRTNYGHHIMYFSGSHPMWRDYVQSDYVLEQTNQTVDEIEKREAFTVDYSTILLANTVLD